MQYSGLAKFSTVEARDQFAREMLGAHPELEKCAYLARNRPDIVFENVSPKQLATLKEALQGRGRWFGDVQFEAVQ